MSTRIQLAGLVAESIVDGPGIRATIFAQGCPHACPQCHNPQSHAFGAGESMDVAALYTRIRQSPMVRGVTFSGGEPFCQPEAFTALALLLKPHGYEIASYSGYTFEALFAGTPAQQALLRQLDILIDGKYEVAQRSLSLLFRGSGNQRILDVPQSLAAKKAVWCTQLRWIGE